MSAASDAGRATRVTLWTGHDAILKRLQAFFSEPKQLTVFKPGHITAMSMSMVLCTYRTIAATIAPNQHIEHI